MIFKTIAALAALTVVSAGQFDPRSLTVTSQLPNGVDLSVTVNAPLANVDIPVAEGTCTVDVLIEATAALGEGVPDTTYIYVIDESGSTGTSGIIGPMKDFFIALTNPILDSTSTKNVGVIAFENAAALRTDLTRTKSDVVSGIDNAASGGGTDCRCGLEAARSLAGNAQAGSNVVVIFAGDGECNARTTCAPLNAWLCSTHSDAVSSCAARR